MALTRQVVDRRRLIGGGLAAGVVAVLNGCAYTPAPPEDQQRARAELRPDGRVRLPPGQNLIRRLKPMGGDPGNPDPAAHTLTVHGLVRRDLQLSFADLLERDVVDLPLDVHCVTGWSAFDLTWTGLRVADLAREADVFPEARHVIFEAAHGYTANVPLEEALHPRVLVAWRVDGDPLPDAHGAPLRAVMPDLYFWKSAKWLTGIRFTARDEPGYWEVRGYHNHGDPWREERYS